MARDFNKFQVIASLHVFFSRRTTAAATTANTKNYASRFFGLVCNFESKFLAITNCLVLITVALNALVQFFWVRINCHNGGNKLNL